MYGDVPERARPVNGSAVTHPERHVVFKLTAVREPGVGRVRTGHRGCPVGDPGDLHRAEGGSQHPGMSRRGAGPLKPGRMVLVVDVGAGDSVGMDGSAYVTPRASGSASGR